MKGVGDKVIGKMHELYDRDANLGKQGIGTGIGMGIGRKGN